MRMLLVGSTGGHFNALKQFKSLADKNDSVWVTFKSSTTEEVLNESEVYWAYGPTNRSLINLFKNFILAFQVIWQEKPELVISTGAGVAVPFLIIGKIFGAKTIFLESFTRVEDLSMSAKLAKPFIDVIYVQWQQLQTKYSRKAKLLLNLNNAL